MNQTLELCKECMKEEIELGDVVILKKKWHQRMTVNKMWIWSRAECVWFDLEGEPHNQIFPIDSLVKIHL